MSVWQAQFDGPDGPVVGPGVPALLAHMAHLEVFAPVDALAGVWLVRATDDATDEAIEATLRYGATDWQYVSDAGWTITIPTWL